MEYEHHSHFQLNSLSLTLNYIFHFTGNKIGDDDARAISEALKTNQSITNINLSCMNTHSLIKRNQSIIKIELGNIDTTHIINYHSL